MYFISLIVLTVSIASQGFEIQPSGNTYWVIVKMCKEAAVSKELRYKCNKDGEVECREGWSMDNCKGPMCATIFDPSDWCSEPQCSPGCDPHNGYCSVPGECVCKSNSGYHGPNCTDLLPSLGCMNGGPISPEERCVCDEGWSGLLCDQPVCHSACQYPRGVCEENGYCHCQVGWEGEHCQRCVTYPGCEHGTCTNPWECVCQQGWMGTFCNQTITSITQDYTTVASV